MTTKEEEAKKLINRCLHEGNTFNEVISDYDINIAKELAVIVIDEILKVLYSLPLGNAIDDEIEFYEQVKEEIEKL